VYKEDMEDIGVSGTAAVNPEVNIQNANH